MAAGQLDGAVGKRCGWQAAARQHESARCRCMGGRQGVCSGSTRGRLGQASRGLAIGWLQGRCVGSVWMRGCWLAEWAHAGDWGSEGAAVVRVAANRGARAGCGYIGFETGPASPRTRVRSISSSTQTRGNAGKGGQMGSGRGHTSQPVFPRSPSAHDGQLGQLYPLRRPPARVRTCGLHRHTEVSRGQGARVCLGSRADIFFLAACMQAGAVRVCADCVIGPARRNA